jgi:hypothetical protein
MEYIIEMNSQNHLPVPLEIVSQLNLQPGAHFTAKLDDGRLIIERLPFSSTEAAKSLNQTIESLQK